MPLSCPLRGGGGQPGRHPGAHEFKQVESCFLNHNSSIHFCCTDSLLMTHCGGLEYHYLENRRRGAKFPFTLEPKYSLGGLGHCRCSSKRRSMITNIKSYCS